MRLLIAVMLLAAATASAEDTPVVKAAKATGRAKTPTKVITNDDVKKSKGKLTESKTTGAPAATTAASTAPAPTKKKKTTTELIAEAQARVTTLEKELATIERRYFDSNNPDERDKVITREFAAKKEELQHARQELDTLTNPATQPPKR